MGLSDIEKLTEKALRRFYIEEIHDRNGYSIISGSEARHITKVLRMDRGDPLILMDRKGLRFRARIESFESDKILVKLEKKIPSPLDSPVNITLCQSILKSNSMDYMVQKTSELGVNRIIPFYSKRTVVKLKGDRSKNRLSHWKQVAQNSAKQADRPTPAKIDHPIAFCEMVNNLKGENALKIIMWEQEDSVDIKGLLKKDPLGKNLICIVGPEGGFASDEVDNAIGADFISISLGNRILRAETAAITITAIIQYEWGDLGIPA